MPLKSTFCKLQHEAEHLKKLFIGGLNPKTDDESLRQYFGTYGKVVDCIVMKDNVTKRYGSFGVAGAVVECLDLKLLVVYYFITIAFRLLSTTNASVVHCDVI